MARRRLGQHFLFDPSILRRIIDVAGINEADTVVEIGPGHGRLTRMLSRVASKVYAIEVDTALYNRLKEELKDYDNIVLIHGDALRFSYGEIGPFKVVANIPYYITTPLLFKLLENKNLISMTLTVQKEVAERIIATPNTKSYGTLSVMVQYHGEPSLRFIIPRGAFRPPPKVDSAVIRIDTLTEPRVRVRDEELFFRIVRTAFGQRRKTLSNALKTLLKGNLKETLKEAGIDPMIRGERLTIAQFARLSDVISQKDN